MDLDLANLKPSLQSFLTVLLMVIVGIPLFKYFFVTRFQIPGFSDLVAAV